MIFSKNLFFKEFDVKVNSSKVSKLLSKLIKEKTKTG